MSSLFLLFGSVQDPVPKAASRISTEKRPKSFLSFTDEGARSAQTQEAGRGGSLARQVWDDTQAARGRYQGGSAARVVAILYPADEKFTMMFSI
jgi:hypothetical protein